AEYLQLADEITRTIASTTFNGLAILADDADTLNFQVGAGSDPSIDAISITTTDLSQATAVTDVTESYTEADTSDPDNPVPASGGILTAADARTAMEALGELINLVTTERATYGAAQNRFESVISNLQVAVESQTAARSR